MLRGTQLLLLGLLWHSAAGEEIIDEEDTCQIGEPCHRAALLQARTNVKGSVLASGSSDVDDKKTQQSTESKAAERQRHLLNLNRTHLAYTTRLRRTMKAYNESVAWSNDEIDAIVSGFVEDQAASQDSCPARLLEAKHQLNELHAQIVDLANEVQITDKELHALEIELSDVRQLIDSVITFCQSEEVKCGQKTQDSAKMLATLKKELVEMQQIAGAQVTIDLSPQGALSSTTSTSSTGFVSATTTATGAGYSPIAWSVSYGVGESTSTTTTGGGAGGAAGGAAGGSTTTTTGMTTGQWTTSTTSGAWTTGAVGASGTTTTTGGFGGAGFGGAGGAGGYSTTTTTTGGYHGGGGAHGGYHRAALMQDAASTAPQGAEGARKLVSETKQLATDLVQCMATKKGAALLQKADPVAPTPAYGVSYGGGTTDADGTYHPPETEGPAECPATLEVDAFVGDAQKVVGSGRPLREGEHATVECSEINPKYKGAVWLVCTNGRLSAKNDHCFEQGGDANQCEEYKKNLEQTYIKAYVNLVRTIAEYESLVGGTNCKSSVYDRCLTQNRGNYEKLEDITARMSHLQAMLLDFKTRFASASRAEEKLKGQIELLTGECHSMDDTVSCLHKVRDAIHLLGLCPGIGRPQFEIPIWTGQWATGDVNCANMMDDQIDNLLNTLCASQISEDGTTARAAECSEIEEHTIEAAPTENTARVPLIGSCPNCEGASNAETGLSSRSGHARKCWDPQGVLSGGGCRKNCQNGMKAVMCVYDRGHIANYFTAQSTQTYGGAAGGQTTQTYGGGAMGGHTTQTYGGAMGGGAMGGGHAMGGGAAHTYHQQTTYHNYR